MPKRLRPLRIPGSARAKTWNPTAYNEARAEAGLTWQALTQAVKAEGYDTSTTALYAYAVSAQRKPPAVLVPILARIFGVPQRRLTQ